MSGLLLATASTESLQTGIAAAGANSKNSLNSKSSGLEQIFGVTADFTIKARLTYLTSNLILMLLSVLYGYWVWEDTQSLTIEVDLLSLSCTLVAVIINIVVEVVKPQLVTVRSVVMADVAGGLGALVMLVCVGVVGVIDAMQATEDLAEHHAHPTRHLEKLVRYGAFALCLSLANLAIFVSLYNLVLPKEGDVHDQLNILSNLAHSLIDFISNFAVFGTAMWLQYGIPNSTWEEMWQHKMWVDVFGSFMISACILISIAVMFREISHSLNWLAEHSGEEEEADGAASAGPRASLTSTPGDRKAQDAVAAS